MQDTERFCAWVIKVCVGYAYATTRAHVLTGRGAGRLGLVKSRLQRLLDHLASDDTSGRAGGAAQAAAETVTHTDQGTEVHVHAHAESETEAEGRQLEQPDVVQVQDALDQRAVVVFLELCAASCQPLSAEQKGENGSQREDGQGGSWAHEDAEGFLLPSNG